MLKGGTAEYYANEAEKFERDLKRSDLTAIQRDYAERRLAIAREAEKRMREGGDIMEVWAWSQAANYPTDK